MTILAKKQISSKWSHFLNLNSEDMPISSASLKEEERLNMEKWIIQKLLNVNKNGIGLGLVISD